MSLSQVSLGTLQTISQRLFFFFYLVKESKHPKKLFGMWEVQLNSEEKHAGSETDLSPRWAGWHGAALQSTPVNIKTC